MQVANGKSEKATGDLIEVFLANNEFCLRLLNCAESACDVVEIESFLKAELRRIVSDIETSARRSGITARGQADLRFFYWKFEKDVDWYCIASAALEGAQGE